MNYHPRPFADAQAALPFVVEQGRNIETTVYRKRYPTLNYAMTLPVVTEGNEWAIGTTFFTVENTGKAKFISGSANDIPFSQTQRGQASHDFAMIGSGWEWNIEEVNQAAMYNLNLSDEKAMGATQALEALIFDTAITGSTEKNWKGFVNQTIVPRADAAGNGGENGGGGTSTFWKHKTNDEILDDINAALTSIRTVTKEVEWADTLRLPPEAFRLLITRRLGDGDGLMTLMNYVKTNNVYTAETGLPLDIQPMYELRNASNDGGGRLVAYRKDREVLRMHLPMPRRVLDPRSKSLMGFEQGIIARIGGTEVRLPYAMTYLDEITDVPS